MLLSGRYELGPALPFALSQGTTFQGRCVATNAPVVLLYPQVPRASDDVLRRCVEAAQREHGPDAVRVLGWARDPRGDRPVLALEPPLGESLAAVIRGRVPLGLEHALWVAGELLTALEQAHAAGRTVGPLAPEDLLVVGEGQGWRLRRVPRLELSDPSLGMPGGVATRVAALPPELLDNALNQSVATDVFAVGMLLYELLSGGRLPVEGKTTRDIIMKVLQGRGAHIVEHRPDLPAHVSTAIQRAIRPEPKDRPPSAAALRAALSGPQPV
ncbi:MAG: protein kinase [Planctomycetota bacterium]